MDLFKIVTEKAGVTYTIEREKSFFYRHEAPNRTLLGYKGALVRMGQGDGDICLARTSLTFSRHLDTSGLGEVYM